MCDDIFGENFDISRSEISREEECSRLSEYETCINNIVANISETDSEMKKDMKRYLVTRIKVRNDVCGKVLKSERNSLKVDVTPEMESELDIILQNPCRHKVKPIIYACIRQYQKRIDNALRRMEIGYTFVEEGFWPSLCSSYAQLSKCVYVVSMLKCGKECAKRMFASIESLRRFSTPIGCVSYNYYTPDCQKVLDCSVHTAFPLYTSVVTFILLFYTTTL